MNTELLERCEWVVVDETGSTNNEVKRRIGDCRKSCLVVQALNQTAGRGQADHRWESERGCNLLYSLGVRPGFLSPKRQFLLLQAASLSVCRVLNRLHSGFEIKWPNDIYYRHDKVSGTLIENALRGTEFQYCVIGTGINVNQTHFSTYPPNPVSLCQIVGHPVSLRPLLEAIVAEFLSLYTDLELGHEERVVIPYCEGLYRREGYHLYRDAEGLFRARITGIDPGGCLRLTDEAGRERTYAFKEVKYVFDHCEMP